MVPEAFLAVSAFGLYCSLAALVRIKRPVVLGWWHMVIGWPTGELAPMVMGLQIATVPVWVLAGALGEPAGWVGLGIDVVSWGFLIAVHRRALGAEASGRRALEETLGPHYLTGSTSDVPAGATPVEPVVTAVPRVVRRPFRLRRQDVVVTRDIPYRPYGRRTMLDVFAPAHQPSAPLPVVVHVHGGAWVVGRKDDQGLPLMFHLAATGAVGVSINYRLAPKHRFPTFLEDVKAALAWVKANIADHGGDPDAVVIAGGSAGGHLAILAALTPNEPRFQPGFEDADTSVAACIPFYGPADILDRAGVRGREQWRRSVGIAGRFLLPHRLTIATLDEWRDASPLHHVHSGAPPFLVIQGSHDVLVWREETRHFVESLRAVSQQPVVYWEVPGAQHAFDVFASPRCFAALATVDRFMTWLRVSGRLGPAHVPTPTA